MLSTLVSIVFCWTVMSMLLSWLFSFAYPLVRRSFNELSANNAALGTLLYGVAPPFSAIIVLLLLMLPFNHSLMLDHCHDGICEPHTLQVTMSTMMGIGAVTLAVVFLLVACFLIGRQLLNKQHHFRTLQLLSQEKLSAYHVVESPKVFAWCVGLWRPKVFISQGLLQKLNEKQLRLVLAHEYSHVHRRDNLRKWLLHWATILWFKHSKQNIRQDLKNHSEQVCDLAAIVKNQDLPDLDFVVSLMGQHCLNAKGISPCKESRQQRLELLKQELHSKQQRYPKEKKYAFTLNHFALLTTLGGIWTVLILSSVYVGHPFLEWLSQ